jgi:hypothetical protein
MVRMTRKETGFVTLNAAILAIAYTLLGVVVSFILYYLFDEFDKEWENRPLWYQLLDVSLEISLLSIIAFWSAHVIEAAPPFFYVRKQLDTLVDSYISGIFYVFAVWVFMDGLTEKLKFIFTQLFGEHFDKYLPSNGVLSLILPSSKTN